MKEIEIDSSERDQGFREAEIDRELRERQTDEVRDFKRQFCDTETKRVQRADGQRKRDKRISWQIKVHVSTCVDARRENQRLSSISLAQIQLYIHVRMF